MYIMPLDTEAAAIHCLVYAQITVLLAVVR